MEILFVLTGIIIGAVGAWLIAKYKFSGEFNTNDADLKIAREKVEYFSTEVVQLKTVLDKEREKVINLNSDLSRTEADYRNLQEKLHEQKQEIEKLQEKFSIEFKNLANEIFEEKSKKFTDQNKTNIGELLSPLKEKITDFEKKVDQSNKENIQNNSALREQLKQLKELNQQITKEAGNLTKALKGDSKTQGNWGEMQLELILESAGLQKEIHYFKEKNYQNEEGKNQRLDYVIKLPDEKYLVLDSKVSLTAYSNYHNTDDEQERQFFLKKHLDSISTHIKNLGDKNYQQIHDIVQPDFVMMFIANEPALIMALQEDTQLYEKALERNIALVSTTTLLVVLRTVSYIWKQDAQSRNAKEIARQAGSLYDKFVNFSEDLVKVGKHLDSSKLVYEEAMKKLSTGKDNLVRKTERIKSLGIDSSKNLNPKLIERSEEN